MGVSMLNLIFMLDEICAEYEKTLTTYHALGDDLRIVGYVLEFITSKHGRSEMVLAFPSSKAAKLFGTVEQYSVPHCFENETDSSFRDNQVYFVAMARVFIGNLNPGVSERNIEDEFRVYGVLKSIWVARKPPGYAFIDFDDRRDALDAIRELDGKNGWRVELSHNSRGGNGGGGGGGRFGGGGGRGGSVLKCYECGEVGHFARECQSRGGPVRRRSRSPPRYRGSPSYGRRPYSPPRRRSFSPRRRSYSRSPVYRGREGSPYANGNYGRVRR